MEEKNSGFIIINKPSGPTSFNIIARLRKITGIKKIGHAGTLDPFASGVLIVAIAREATRKIDTFVKKDKTYIADLILGAETDTYDREGQITKEYKTEPIDKKEIIKILEKFQGPQKQIPPMFSAKKVGGKKLYELARKGIEIERKPVDINIHKIKLLKYSWPKLQIEVTCSSGTYIRSLGFDIGRELNCGAYLEELQRTAIDKYSIKDSIEIEKLDSKNWKKYLF